MSSGLKAFLYFTAALTGAGVMVIEILGSKILAPYTGTSHYVWIAQITVTMTALAAGYYGGGRLVDRSRNVKRLYGLIVAAALYILAGVPLSPIVAGPVSSLSAPLATMLCSAILFGPPLTALATVCPFFIRLLTRSVASAGRMAGRMSSISTAGSLAGTVLVGYILLPSCSNSMTMNLLALALISTAVAYWVIWDRAPLPLEQDTSLAVAVSSPNIQNFRPGLTAFLYLTAGLTGACVMIVEVLGVKILAPYLGTSHFVWTAQITVTMIAMAVGYSYGGRLVEELQDLAWLYLGIFGASLWLCAGIPLLPHLAASLSPLSPPLGSLFCAALLFAPPMTLLAMTCPFLVGFMTVSLKSLGMLTGRISAVSTAGGLIGTLLIGYVLLPLCSNSSIMSSVAAVLGILSLVYVAGWLKRGKLVLLVAGAALLAAALTIAFSTDDRLTGPKADELYFHNSAYGMQQVFQLKNPRTPRVRFLATNNYVQNLYNADQKAPIGFEFGFHWLLKNYLAEEPRRVLFIGMGAGVGPMFLSRRGSEVDIIEINPNMVDLAERFFDFDRTRFDLRIEDGRYALKHLQPGYDGIILDVFLGASPPGHLMTRESFQEIKRLLKPEGVLVINTNFQEVQRSRSFLMLHRTVAAVFPHVVVHVGGLNAQVVASSRSLPAPPADSRIGSDFSEDYRSFVEAMMHNIIAVDSSSQPILTDEFNPFDFYDAAERDLVHRSLSDWLKHLLGAL